MSRTGVWKEAGSLLRREILFLYHFGINHITNYSLDSRNPTKGTFRNRLIQFSLLPTTTPRQFQSHLSNINLMIHGVCFGFSKYEALLLRARVVRLVHAIAHVRSQDNSHHLDGLPPSRRICCRYPVGLPNTFRETQFLNSFSGLNSSIKFSCSQGPLGTVVILVFLLKESVLSWKWQGHTFIILVN